MNKGRTENLLSEIFNTSLSEVKKILTYKSWHRKVELYQIGKRKIVIKRKKKLQLLRTLSLWFSFYLVSFFSLSLSSLILSTHVMTQNEKRETRNELRRIEIYTPDLYAVNDNYLIEEFVEGTDLYKWSHSSNLKSACRIVYKVGCLTGKLHKNNWSFIDNKAQNYLVNEYEKIYRVDTGFLQKTADDFQKFMDIGTFLGSLLDLEHSKYERIVQSFLEGYYMTTGKDVPLKTFLVRNMVSLLLAPRYTNTIRNMWIPPKETMFTH